MKHTHDAADSNERAMGSKVPVGPETLKDTGGSEARAVVISGAVLEDARGIQDVLSCQGVIAMTIRLPHTPAHEMETILRLPDPSAYHLVARVDGRVVGYVRLRVEQQPGLRHSGEIEMLAVHDDFQRRGIGSALMSAVLDLADNYLQLVRVSLDVFPDSPARKLYERLGFEVEGRARARVERGGCYLDLIWMARLRLDPKPMVNLAPSL